MGLIFGNFALPETQNLHTAASTADRRQSPSLKARSLAISEGDWRL